MIKQNDINTTSRGSAGPYRSKESHDAILKAAEELLSEGGLSALTFESIARRARAGKATLYRWWPNRTALLLEIYERQKKRAFIPTDQGNIRDDLKVLTKNLWSFWRKDNAGAAFAALIAEAQVSDESQRVLASYFNSEDSGLSLSCFEKARQRGEISDGVNLTDLRKAYVAMNWFHLLCGYLDDERIGPAVDLLLNGFLAKNQS